MAAGHLMHQQKLALRLLHSVLLSSTCSRRISNSHEGMHGTPNSNVDEAEPVMKHAGQDGASVLVLGGNGFVGSHICKEALGQGLQVMSLNRSGRPAIEEAWVNSVKWVQGNLFEKDNWSSYFDNVSAVISCVGGFGSNAKMRKTNGDANIAAVNVAAEKGVQRFVYISAADFGFPTFVLRGYYEGKKATEDAIRLKFPYNGVILRPGFIYGNRRIGQMTLPLSVIGTPLELALRSVKPLTQVPVFGPLFIPPVKATVVAKAALRAAVDNAVPPGVLDVWGILRLGDRS